MVKIGDVWDSTTDVLSGRAGLLASLAAIAFVLPSAVQSAVKCYGGASSGATIVGTVVGLIALGIGLWGQLAVIAVASDPATSRTGAGAAARARLPAALLVVLVLIAAATALTIPILAVVVAHGYDFAAAARQGAARMSPLSPTVALLLLFYGMALIVGGLWVMARLFVTYVVVLRERRAIGALGRSAELTRGLTFKLIAVVLLFGIVYLVATYAAQMVTGLGFRLLLGASHPATVQWLALVATAFVTAAFTVVVQVFAARLYAAVTGGDARAAA